MNLLRAYQTGVDVLGADAAAAAPLKFTITQTPSSAATATPIVDAPPIQAPLMPLAGPLPSLPSFIPAGGPQWPAPMRQDAPGDHRPELSDQTRRALSAMNVMVIAGLVGGIAGGVGGALLWPAHSILGLLIGSIIVGGPTGGTIGWLIAANKIAK